MLNNSRKGSVIFMEGHTYHSVEQNKESRNNPHKYFNVCKSRQIIRPQVTIWLQHHFYMMQSNILNVDLAKYYDSIILKEQGKEKYPCGRW